MCILWEKSAPDCSPSQEGQQEASLPHVARCALCGGQGQVRAGGGVGGTVGVDTPRAILRGGVDCQRRAGSVGRVAGFCGSGVGAGYGWAAWK